MLRPPLALILASLIILVACAGSAGAATRSCASVVFEKNSENAALQIRATNVGCKTARAVARKSRNYGPDDVDGKRHSYRSRGFSCQGVEHNQTLPIVDWKCTKGSARITFSKG
ncbi:MAG: hypothetical protein ACSLFR_00010 [Solirubrobacteraceae bacterium]